MFERVWELGNPLIPVISEAIFSRYASPFVMVWCCGTKYARESWQGNAEDKNGKCNIHYQSNFSHKYMSEYKISGYLMLIDIKHIWWFMKI